MPDPANTAREVHSILASAVSDPTRLYGWRHDTAVDGEAIKGLGDFDFAAVWRFTGLVNKVRYNDLRTSFPAVFKALDVAGISIELFASYAPTAAKLRAQGRNSKSAKIFALTEFMEDWLDHGESLHAIIWDLIRHETALFHLRALAANGTIENRRQDTGVISCDSMPMTGADTFRFEMKCDPVSASRIVLSGGALATVAVIEPTVFAYCLDKGNLETIVLAIDDLASFLLNTADGGTSVSEMAEQLQTAGIGIDAANLIGPVSALVSSGLLEIPEGQACA